jgi:hypothetical protein
MQLIKPLRYFFSNATERRIEYLCQEYHMNLSWFCKIVTGEDTLSEHVASEAIVRYVKIMGIKENPDELEKMYDTAQGILMQNPFHTFRRTVKDLDTHFTNARLSAAMMRTIYANLDKLPEKYK